MRFIQVDFASVVTTVEFKCGNIASHHDQGFSSVVTTVEFKFLV